VLTFFAVVIGIYVAECVYWVQSGEIVLTGARRGRWRASVGPLLTFGPRGGGSVAPLLPPLGIPIGWSADAGDRPLSRDARKAAAKRIDRFYEAAEPVWVGSNALWLFLFVLAPIVVEWRGLAATWPLLLTIGLAVLSYILFTFWSAHRELYPDAPQERRSKTILMGVSPLGAIRAVDHLARRLLVGTHPLVAAVVLCRRDEAIRLGRWMYFAPETRDDGLRRFLETCDLWEAVLAPPAGETGATAFCPRCHAQYVRVDGGCSDCAGVELVKWTPSPAPTPSAPLKRCATS
jgi:hypothetical protein